MSGACRPKRKAAVAANDAIIQIKKQQKQDEEDDRKAAAIISGAAENDHQQDFTDPILFCGDSLALPQGIFIDILDFLPKNDLVHGASLVSTAWNNATKNPFLWLVLDAAIWKKYPPNRRSGGPPPRMAFSSMRKFHAFLQRPQFAQLQTLVPPDIYRTRFLVFERISQSCPLLQDLDLSGSTSIRLHSMVAYPEELVLLPRLFPKLTKIKICMRRLQADHVTEFARRMGDRLVELDVRAYENDREAEDDEVILPADGRHDLLDSTLQAIAQSCPNLQLLSYEFSSYLGSWGRLTERGPMALLQNCPKLQRLKLTLPPRFRWPVANFIHENGYDLQRGIDLGAMFFADSSSDLESLDDGDGL